MNDLFLYITWLCTWDGLESYFVSYEADGIYYIEQKLAWAFVLFNPRANLHVKTKVSEGRGHRHRGHLQSTAGFWRQRTQTQRPPSVHIQASMLSPILPIHLIKSFPSTHSPFSCLFIVSDYFFLPQNTYLQTLGESKDYYNTECKAQHGHPIIKPLEPDLVSYLGVSPCTAAAGKLDMVFFPGCWGSNIHLHAMNVLTTKL